MKPLVLAMFLGIRTMFVMSEFALNIPKFLERNNISQSLFLNFSDLPIAFDDIKATSSTFSIQQ